MRDMSKKKIRPKGSYTVEALKDVGLTHKTTAEKGQRKICFHM